MIKKRKTDPKPTAINWQRDQLNSTDKKHTGYPTNPMVDRTTGVPVYMWQSIKTQKEAHTGNTVCLNVFNAQKSIK